MNIIAEYTNGNTHVVINNDGTKTRTIDDSVVILDHPESIDVKITNYCDLGCKWCHEASTRSGVHADLSKLLDVISCLPPGVELAIGGGNPLSHPDLSSFLLELKNRGLIANITINQGHLKRYSNSIAYIVKHDLVKGIGISVLNSDLKFAEKILNISDNVVFHLIAGVNDVSILDTLFKLKYCKILILGYKVFGFGINFYNQDVLNNLKKWYHVIPKILGKCTLSFDNLAIEQLQIKRLFTREGWNKFYMGDDFCYTMYIDAVKQEYAATSRSVNRVSFAEKTLLEFFRK